MILGAVRERLADAESLRYVFEKVEAEVAKLLATAPDDIRQKEAELDATSEGSGEGSNPLRWWAAGAGPRSRSDR
jgi:hypothetical protein